MIPVVWVGGLCGVVTDAMPGTRAHDECECEYCGSECVAVATEASEYDVADPELEDESEESAFDLSDVEVDFDDVLDAEWSLDAAGHLWEDDE